MLLTGILTLGYCCLLKDGGGTVGGGRQHNFFKAVRQPDGLSTRNETDCIRISLKCMVSIFAHGLVLWYVAEILLIKDWLSNNLKFIQKPIVDERSEKELQGPLRDFRLRGISGLICQFSTNHVQRTVQLYSKQRQYDVISRSRAMFFFKYTIDIHKRFSNTYDAHPDMHGSTTKLFSTHFRFRSSLTHRLPWSKVKHEGAVYEEAFRPSYTGVFNLKTNQMFSFHNATPGKFENATITAPKRFIYFTWRSYLFFYFFLFCRQIKYKYFTDKIKKTYA